jgi:hypothetical protein
MEGQKPSCNSQKIQNKKNWREAGQLSIFLGVVLLVVTTFVAFVINVGLFVKAKINLQNSVDAAAYAGAAVQARQLTNIGYLNWEIRNTYKEWLFKYYILGNIGLDAIDNIDGTEPAVTGGCPSSLTLNNGGMNFRLRQFKGSDCRYYKADVYDHYNAPSICIHFGSNNNICEIVTLPGLPRFNTVGLPSISEQHESFLNNIVATKSDDCSSRSNINLGAAMLWTYGTGNANMMPGVPEIAPTRIGAWVQALELALRVRNLEAIVNQPPLDLPMCRNALGDTPCTEIEDIMNDGSSLPFQERSVKAFWSAYRNLSGGVFKENNNSQDFAASFLLRELKPTPFPASENSLSGFLIPAGEPALEKHYLDLKVMPINYALFYTSFYSKTGEFSGVTDTPDSEGECGGTKTALPAPGYILGFVKNPEVVTYYAVEGEAKFIGLFYPFSDPDGITLKTYAAAKPFGGRIGPVLFDPGFSGADTQVKTRDDNKRSSSNYISAFNTAGLPDPTTESGVNTLISGGYPVPTISDFWVSSTGSAVVGGNPVESGSTGFGIPNLLYDFNNYQEIRSLGDGVLPVNDLKNAANDAEAYQVNVQERDYGLYDIDQFRKFKDNKVGSGGAAIFSVQEIHASIHRVRRATRYEALNYMIPLLDDGTNPTGQDANSYVQEVVGAPPPSGDPNTKIYRLFAPLYGPETLYDTPASIVGIINRYIQENSSAITTYTEALKQIADGMRNQASRGGDAYVTAANSIYKEPLNGPHSSNDINSDECRGLSMAQKFAAFFSDSPKGCGITPLADLTREYFNNGPSVRGADFQYYYRSTWQVPTFAPNLEEALTGFMPGPRQGADPDGNYASPFGGEVQSGRRNSYSTKFIPIKKVIDSGTPYGTDSLPILIDPPGDSPSGYTSGNLVQGIRMRNTLSSTDLQAYGSNPSF